MCLLRIVLVGPCLHSSCVFFGLHTDFIELHLGGLSYNIGSYNIMLGVILRSACKRAFDAITANRL